MQNTKFEVSKFLVDQGIDFFFFEMDVWFTRSPQPLIEAQRVDLLLSSHQNNARSGNIGVYSVFANAATREFFEDCIEMAKRLPHEHDQRLMMNLAVWHSIAAGRGHDPKEWKDRPTTEPAKNPISSDFWDPHVVVSSTRPVPVETTVAIHPLGTKPLQHPHGKKILALELGAWHGSRGSACGTRGAASRSGPRSRRSAGAAAAASPRCPAASTVAGRGSSSCSSCPR